MEIVASLAKAFLVGGLFCAVGQLLIDKTKLTPARILVSYVVIGVILGAIGVYQPFVEFAGAGASVPLTGFGNILAKGVKEAILDYEVQDSIEHPEEGRLSLIRILLLTGRTHQIRVQCASRGIPLVGDGKYGSRTKAGAPALFAAGLTFPHPKTGKMLSFCAPTPTDFPWSLFASQKYEIEHKYLIAMPERALLDGLSSCRKLLITQTYLIAASGETHRVRRVCENGSVSFYETRKRRVTALRAVEQERTLTEQEYNELLTLQDSTRTPIEKLRYRVPHGEHTVEIDVYPFWQDRAIAEVEVES